MPAFFVPFAEIFYEPYPGTSIELFVQFTLSLPKDCTPVRFVRWAAIKQLSKVPNVQVCVATEVEQDDKSRLHKWAFFLHRKNL
ncbi:hypothetical protein [Flavisolibacter ginsenosidimutans]|uniref:Uncharacterized protein n=1 Tax=Flavisolibacter ginsenosidimutans TaxID=661481 RepID=A0A5B8UFV0_9BACT|nr:hypothetical protein [Flavisolibacter ginsenosidimutans]QEC55186.1 hypothetical protein FSB75_04450 [Flavisolibacter ginsenosidimutans]